MSYTLRVYQLTFDSLIQMCGSKNATLLSNLTERFAREIDENADYFQSEIEAGAPTLAEALHTLIMGSEMQTAYGFQYAYAYELLCKSNGDLFPNEAFSDCDSQWLTQIDDTLQGLGLNAHITDLCYGSALIKFPRPDDFPAMGSMYPAKVLATYEALAQCTPELFKQHQVNANIQSAILQFKNYCFVAKQNECGLVGFYY